jgi:hypothetical protein
MKSLQANLDGDLGEKVEDRWGREVEEEVREFGHYGKGRENSAIARWGNSQRHYVSQGESLDLRKQISKMQVEFASEPLVTDHETDMPDCGHTCRVKGVLYMVEVAEETGSVEDETLEAREREGGLFEVETSSDCMEDFEIWSLTEQASA